MGTGQLKGPLVSLLFLRAVAAELAYDLPGDGFALQTWADSAVDVVVVALGYLWAFRVKMGRLGLQVKTGGRG